MEQTLKPSTLPANWCNMRDVSLSQYGKNQEKQLSIRYHDVELGGMEGLVMQRFLRPQIAVRWIATVVFCLAAVCGHLCSARAAENRRSTTVTVKSATVKSARTHVSVSFNNEVEPILTRLGCNQGACHGAQYGKGGFKLSLAAFDPDLDYTNIVKQMRGRRVSRVDPAQSLLLLKPILRVPHGGGWRLERGSASYRTLLQWLHDG